MKTCILTLGVLALLSTLGCEDLGTPSGEQRIPMRSLTSGEQALVTADNTFGFKLLAAVNKEDAGKDVFVSPVSVSMALGMTLNGANAATRDSMARTLEFAGLTQADINSSYKSLIALLTSIDPKVKFQIANSIWYRPDLLVEQAFKDVNSLHFNAEINSLNFSDPGAAKTINGWVDRSTNGKIKEIVPDPIPRDIVMYLINAIYFKGTWRYSFDPKNTRDDSFTLPNGSKTTCKMMYLKGDLRCTSTDQVQAMDLAYGDAGFSMTILLPNAGTNIDEFAGRLTQEQWISIVSGLTTKEAELYFPKFKLEYSKKLNNVLKAMGMSIAFSPDLADFTNIDKRGGLFISDVQHKTFVQVDEEGTEAAAVTSVGVGRTSIGDTFVMRIDRPFVFVIRENHSGTILFVGKIVEPKL
jgi:serpin B